MPMFWQKITKIIKEKPIRQPRLDNLSLSPAFLNKNDAKLVRLKTKQIKKQDNIHKLASRRYPSWRLMRDMSST